MDDSRRKKINAALNMGYSVNDLQAAIFGCSMTPFNMGENDNGQKYDGLNVIFKNAENIDRFITNSKTHGTFDDNREAYIQKRLPPHLRSFPEDNDPERVWTNPIDHSKWSEPEDIPFSE